MINEDMRQEWLAFRAEQLREQKRDAVKRVLAAETQRKDIDVDEARRLELRIERLRATGGL